VGTVKDIPADVGTGWVRITHPLVTPNGVIFRTGDATGYGRVARSVPPQAANAVGERDPGPARVDRIPNGRMDRCPWAKSAFASAIVRRTGCGPPRQPQLG